jgi:hypothetical protein
MTALREITPPSYSLLDHTVLDPETGCRRWTKAVNSAGYGVACIGKKTYKAHRVSYVQAFGPIPVDRPHIDHVHERGCRWRDCIEPSHLEAVTQAENNRRAGAANPTCPKGHNDFRRHPDGRRQCRTCKSDYDRGRYRKARKAGQK